MAKLISHVWFYVEMWLYENYSRASVNDSLNVLMTCLNITVIMPFAWKCFNTFCPVVEADQNNLNWWLAGVGWWLEDVLLLEPLSYTSYVFLTWPHAAGFPVRTIKEELRLFPVILCGDDIVEHELHGWAQTRCSAQNTRALTWEDIWKPMKPHVWC